MRRAVSTGTTCYTIYADIASAFYSVVTNLVAGRGSEISDEGFRDLTSRLNLLPGELQALRAHLDEPASLASTGASAWLQSITERMSTHNWFLLKGDEVPVATMRGTRPGSSFADLVFAMLIPKILKCRDSLRGDSQRSVAPGTAKEPLSPARLVRP